MLVCRLQALKENKFLLILLQLSQTISYSLLRTTRYGNSEMYYMYLYATESKLILAGRCHILHFFYFSCGHITNDFMTLIISRVAISRWISGCYFDRYAIWKEAQS